MQFRRKPTKSVPGFINLWFGNKGGTQLLPSTNFKLGVAIAAHSWRRVFQVERWTVLRFAQVASRSL